MQRRSTQGVVFVHACPKALCQHVDWALERVIGGPVSLSWAEQPAQHGAELASWADVFQRPAPEEVDGSEPIPDPPTGFADWDAWREDRWPPAIR